MDFNLTETQKTVRERARQFAASELRPLVSQIEREDRFPMQVWDALRNHKLWGIAYPKNYGGSGEGYVSYFLALEEISRVGIAIAATLSVHSMAAATIFHYGTEEQKRQFLPTLLSGEKIGSFSFTEQATGSNPRDILTVAVREGNYYLLNGAKMFSSNSTLEGYTVIFAKDAERENQISAFILTKGCEGYQAGPLVNKMGLSGFETAPFSLRNVRVPVSSVVGGDVMRGRGFEILLDMIAIGKLGIAAQSLGLAEQALEEAVSYADKRKQLNKPLRLFPTIQTLIAEMATDIEASRWLTYFAALQRENEQNIAFEGAMAKLFCTQAAKRVIDKALSIHGCYGYTKDYTIERLYREVKLGELYEGTAEMQKILIASKILWSRSAQSS